MLSLPRRSALSFILPLAAALAACTAPAPPPAEPPPALAELCINPPADQLCSELPHDVTEEIDALDYANLDAEDQRPFDVFSWQSFVALNWPANPDGTPSSSPIGSEPDAPRVWQFYINPHDVFGLSTEASAACPETADGDRSPLRFMTKALDEPVEANAFLEAVVNEPLIDSQLNFVLYAALVNDVEADYITSNSLNTVAGQQAFFDEGKPISFPLGYYADRDERTGGSPGAIELKFAWRLLDPERGDDPSRFFTREGLVQIPGSSTVNGEELCFEATLGLVGFHIIQRTTGPYRDGAPFPQDWIWSTFEHVDNSPLSADPLDPTSTQAGPDTCAPPTDGSGDWSFYNAACTDCQVDQPPDKGSDPSFLWETDPPYARRYAVDGQFGSQVVRCRSIFPETAEVTAVFQEALAGTVWANYRLINTQWQGDDTVPGTTGNVPPFLANTSLETYIQGDSSCLSCHGSAQTAVQGQSGNFSFLLQLAAASGS